MILNIRYGILEKNIDITDICFTKLNTNGVIFIPRNDHIRSNIFTDPARGRPKNIFINNDGILSEYSHEFSIFIDTVNNKIYTDNVVESISTSKYSKLENIHRNLKIKHGSFNDEYPEQLMVVDNLTGHEKVLELGSNVGRNSLIIGSILSRCGNNNFVSLECNLGSFKQLEENKNLNNMNFHIENSALSKRKLIQHGWDTKPLASGDVIPHGWEPVNSIDHSSLVDKYNIHFDTLVVDCEGALYYILQDMPEILEGVRMVIMENDYHQISHKEYVDKLLREYGLEIVYSESGGWGCCSDRFYEVWKK